MLSLIPDTAHYDSSDVPDATIAQLRIQDICSKLDIFARPGSFLAAFSIKAFQLVSLSQGLAQPIYLITPKDRPVLQPSAEQSDLALLDVSKTDSAPFVSLSIETNPLDVYASVKFRMISQPLEVTYVPSEISALTAFFEPAQQVDDVDTMIDLSSHHEAPVDRFELHAKYLTLDAKLEIAAPLVCF